MLPCRCPLSGAKRTSRGPSPMSVNDPKRTFIQRSGVSAEMNKIRSASSLCAAPKSSDGISFRGDYLRFDRGSILRRRFAWAGATLLFTSATLMVTLAGFSILFLVIRQAIGQQLSAVDLFLTRAVIALLFTMTARRYFRISRGRMTSVIPIHFETGCGRGLVLKQHRKVSIDCKRLRWRPLINGAYQQQRESSCLDRNRRGRR